ncbi:MAG: hypothetical protein EU535_00250 [Promethearchaeota archaeon]|nr:MAG: hypothetical protein EU535_00250 [Candidatus Lokiarchaeota archaeon]
MENEYFWKLIRKYNHLMKSSIIGPDCIDPEICRGDCCSIKIDIPKVLAKEYIKRGYATKEDFIRSDIFSFQLRFNEKTGKCFLFDKEINGCKVHNSGIKPPQCWIYPTGFSNSEGKEISCKKTKGWKIINSENLKQAEKLLNFYNFLCQVEAKKELNKINKRVGKKISKNSKKNLELLKNRLKEYAPSHIGGFKDTWDFIDILSAEGISLQLKKFCNQNYNQCNYLPDKFLECNKICEIIACRLIEFFQDIIADYIKTNGPDTDGHYPLINLFKFYDTKKKSYMKE